MADLFLSDVHLRLDRPDRSQRLKRVVDRFTPSDTLYVVGDLCDFWFASRQRKDDPQTCAGLNALRDFRTRGGKLIILGGNHDQWLGEFFTAHLGAEFAGDSVSLNSFGTNAFVTHGHRLGARNAWKAGMESRLFLNTFSRIPNKLAHHLEGRLDRSNDAHREAADRTNLATFRREVDRLKKQTDVVILGHIHQLIDEQRPSVRMIVLGNWHVRASYLMSDESGMRLVVEED